MAGAFDLRAFHERAVRTPSHESVEEMRDLLVGTLADAGVDPRVDDAGNVLATRTAAGDGADDATPGERGPPARPHLVLNTHIDTVPPHVPYGRDGDRVTGRGACDAKGPLAALVDAFLSAEVARGRVTLAVTPDEETHSTGAAALAGVGAGPGSRDGDEAGSDGGAVNGSDGGAENGSDRGAENGNEREGGDGDGRGGLDADGYIVGEPTGLDVCTAAKGRFEGTVTVRGSAAHAAEPDSGASAIAGAARLVESLGAFAERGPGAHDALGAPTLTATTIGGGDATNQVPATCRFTVDRRSVPPETADGFREAFLAFLRERAPPDVAVDFSFADRDTPFLEAFATDPDEPLVRTLVAASGGTVRPFSAATEASYFAAGAPTVVFGPGVLADEEGAVAHADREYVDLPEVEAAARAVRETVERVLG